MKFDLAQFVQRGHHFAIVDEVDSILIDEARTPLIISGPAEESTDLYYEVDRIIPKLVTGRGHAGQRQGRRPRALETTGDYLVDEKHKTVQLTESGMAKAEKLLAHRLVPDSNGLYDPVNMPLLHHIHQGLRAHTLFKLDVDYMIKDGQVVIVDEFTGRLMPGRRWSDGLHQAVEAKEKVKIERENQTLATITFQNYFRKYRKLVRHDRHGRDRGRRVRQDLQARRHRRAAQPARWRARKSPTASTAPSARSTTRSSTTSSRSRRPGRPTLVGTVSIEKSEKLEQHAQAARHQARRAEREVPRAGSRDRRAGGPQGRRHHRDEHGRPRHGHPARRQRRVHGASADAHRISWPSGCPRGRRSSSTTTSSSTSTTSTASTACHARTTSASSTPLKQQTDASTKRSSALGGLHIIGTERHEARRIDNQLRGRAGRQGDPGSSRFYLSLEDDLMRIFGSDRIAGLMQRLGHGRGRADRARHGHQGHRARAEAGRSAELRHPQTPARVRRRDEQAARERLHAAPRAARRRDSSSTTRTTSRRHARLRDDAGRGPGPESSSRRTRRKDQDAERVGPRRPRRAARPSCSASSRPRSRR